MRNKIDELFELQKKNSPEYSDTLIQKYRYILCQMLKQWKITDEDIQNVLEKMRKKHNIKKE